MQGGAIELSAASQAQLASEGVQPDAILATDMVNLPAYLGLQRHVLRNVPVLLYMHENQLTYPWRPGEKPDLTYAMINWQSMLCADRVVFNSHYHLDGWFGEVAKLLKHFPDYNHLELIGQVRDKSSVLPVGIATEKIRAEKVIVERSMIAEEASSTKQSPLILWNQRWEYDKRPDLFFDLLYRLRDAGVDFRLAVAGENFRNVPKEFDEAQERLVDQIVHWGYVDTYTDYVGLLCRADLVVSTATHEFFGVSVLEAIAAGAFPLLPKRLSYPELIPSSLHAACLYENPDELFVLAKRRLCDPRPAPPSLQKHVVEHFRWPHVAAQYDQLIEELVREGKEKRRATRLRG